MTNAEAIEGVKQLIGYHEVPNRTCRVCRHSKVGNYEALHCGRHCTLLSEFGIVFPVADSGTCDRFEPNEKASPHE